VQDNTDLKPDRAYHHGDLANALTDAAMDLARRGGPEAVVLREAARQVGVSATAAYRHFSGHGDLMESVKERALAGLAAAMEHELAAAEPLRDPTADALRRLYALGKGYLTFALNETGLFRTAFCHSTDPVTGEPPQVQAMSSRPFQLLSEVIEDLSGMGVLPPQRRPFAELMAWSTVHGLAVLIIDGPLSQLPEEELTALLARSLDFCRDGICVF
jgi:AcrR family transcriptional regulator